MSRGSRDPSDDFMDGLHTIQQAWEIRDQEVESLREALKEKIQRVKALETKVADLESEVIGCRRRVQMLEGENGEMKTTLRQMEQSKSKFESVKRTILTTLQGAETEEDVKVPPSPHNTSTISGYSAVASITPVKSRELSKQSSPSRLVDGKKFFSATRKRLSYEAFSEFLSYIKRVNNKEISREQALDEVRPVFGPDNEDLYDDFVVLLTRKAIG